MNLWCSEYAIENAMETFQERLPAWLTASKVPGLSVSLLREGDIFWSDGFGVGSVATGEVVTSETVFEAASLTKPLFAYAALRLYAQGHIELDRPLSAYLDEPYLPDEPQFSQVTMRHVLSHTAGLPNWRPQGKRLRMVFAPGERFSYSGEGFVFLNHVLAQVTGQAPLEWLTDGVLPQLGMQHSRLVWSEGEELPVAVGHDENGEPQAKGLWPDFNAAASLHCTAVDFARFLGAVLQSSPKQTPQLPPDVRAQMIRPQISVNNVAPWQAGWSEKKVTINPQVSWGLGWGIQHSPLGDAIWHWGDNGNYRALAIGYPQEGHGLVLMTNGKNGHQVIKRVLREVVGGLYPALDWMEEINAG